MNPSLQNRLTPLSDGRPGLRSLLPCQITAPHPNPPSSGSPLPGGPPPGDGRGAGAEGSTANCLDFVSSDATLDRYGEIISPAGWDLAPYLTNPVFQNSHQYGDIIHTIGKALITEVRTVADRQVLLQRIQFAVEANPIARIAYPLYAHGYLRAVSVGFIPLRWEDGAADSPCRRRYIQQQLLEVSAVSIPANPAALALAIKSGAIIKSDLQETLELLRQVVPKTPPPVNPTLAPLARLLAQMVRRL
ncbi:MAG TPA: HK97 family phage prohead protease [Verrucomicrobiae bacterium]|nr:HK97 family phage prohead protease [Verrucomicrobiae bacterium]